MKKIIFFIGLSGLIFFIVLTVRSCTYSKSGEKKTTESSELLIKIDVSKIKNVGDYTRTDDLLDSDFWNKDCFYFNEYFIERKIIFNKKNGKYPELEKKLFITCAQKRAILIEEYQGKKSRIYKAYKNL